MTVYIFPGQGSQKKGMGAHLFKKFPRLVSIADTILGYSLVDLCLLDGQNQLNQTQYTQPALYVVNVLAYLEKYYETGSKPDYAAGHSLGEYVALYCADVFDFETGLKLVQKRGALMAAVEGGSMAAVVGLCSKKVAAILDENGCTAVEIANDNSPKQVVISGCRKDIESVQPIFEQAGADMFIPLKVSGAFHSSFMKEVSQKFLAHIEMYAFNMPTLPVIANYSALPYAPSRDAIIHNLVHQMAHKVRWAESIQYLLQQGQSNYKEITAGKEVVTQLVEQIKGK